METRKAGTDRLGINQSINLFSQLCNNKNKCQQNNVKHSDELPEKANRLSRLVAQISTKFYTKQLKTDGSKD